MRCTLPVFTAFLACVLTSAAQAKPLAVLYPAEGADPNAKAASTLILLWDSEWLERVSGDALPDDFQEPTHADLCEQGSSWFIHLAKVDRTPVSPGAYYAVTEAAGTPLPPGTDPNTVLLPPSQQAFMYVALPSGPIVAQRGAVVVHEINAHEARVTMAAYLPFPPGVPEDKSYSYSATFVAKACADLSQGDPASPMD